MMANDKSLRKIIVKKVGAKSPKSDAVVGGFLTDDKFNKQLKNYKAFFRFLLNDKNENLELAD